MIERFRFRDVELPDLDVQLDSEGTLVIQLSAQFADSIRAGYTVALDERILKALKQPTSRTLYRLLEAHRTLPNNPDERVVSLNVKLMEWRTACGITSTRPEIIRRTLTPTHEELLNCGYLQTAEFQGRGQKQLVAYVFGLGARDPDPDLVERLVRHGVVRGVAAKLTLDNSSEYLFEQLSRYEAMLAGGLKPRTRGALLVDLIKNPGKYVDPEGYIAPKALENARVRVEQRVQRAVEEVEAREESHENLARAVALLLTSFGLTKLDLIKLPTETLRELRTKTLGHPQAQREDAARLAKAMLSAL